ncbi:hypothetical protein LOTGIDRAFT_175822 [Lottia gigantea]|uniref:Uncharacterized protein n=1 Tax=Lottia gigantea TaxID=225164 RepID=V4A1A1_LOTGI|nr:hypothetical protein LOTGIDRAFT_175822 [Lottia gigantea]ESO90422.1 hypothetical protein LOTGIDRAFT_175822 [Lottia gigantea]
MSVTMILLQTNQIRCLCSKHLKKNADTMNSIVINFGVLLKKHSFVIIGPGCSIVAFAIELIHHSWDIIPMEGFKYSSSSLATDNLVRYGVQPRVLEIFVDFYLVDLEKVCEVYTDRASMYMNKVLMVWHGSSSCKFQIIIF